MTAIRKYELIRERKELDSMKSMVVELEKYKKYSESIDKIMGMMIEDLKTLINNEISSLDKIIKEE